MYRFIRRLNQFCFGKIKFKKIADCNGQVFLKDF